MKKKQANSATEEPRALGASSVACAWKVPCIRKKPKPISVKMPIALHHGSGMAKAR